MDDEEPLLHPTNTDDGNESDSKELRRNLVAFWVIGLCNNFGYVVMLTAAFDILKVQEHHSIPAGNSTTYLVNNGKEIHTRQNATGFHCNPTSTGLVLLADILPSLMLKLTAPFYMQRINYHIRVAVVILCLFSSLLILAYSTSVLISIFAIILASISSGLGELTILSLSTHFKRSTVSAWSSGTGMSGIVGSVAYAGLLQIGLSKRHAVLFLLIVPVTYLISVWIILKFPETLRFSVSGDSETEHSIVSRHGTSVKDLARTMTLKEKLEIVFTLKKYMIPMFIVYLAEYTTNQGLYELLYYDITWLTQDQQYRWFQVDYQIAVFISRSSVYLFYIKKLMYLSIGQCVIFVILLLEVCFTFIPSIFITFAIIFVEGLLGGAVYVNTFFRMTEEVEEDIREFAIGAATISDSAGISLSGAIALPLHNALCRLKSA